MPPVAARLPSTDECAPPPPPPPATAARRPLFMPASDTPNGTIALKNLPRGDTSKPQSLNVPNWASTNHTVMVVFSDYPQD